MMEKELARKDPTAYPMSQDLFNKKLGFIKKYQSGTTLSELNKTFSQAYKWGYV